MAKSHDIKETGSDIYQAALERMEYVFDNFDHVFVSFSGGKDSTAAMQIALEVARQKKRLPLRVITFDEECIPPQTVEYMQRVSENPEINFEWYCMPIQHRNACSRKQPYWYPWNPDKKKLWVRQLPESAITELQNFKRTGIPELLGVLAPKKLGTVAAVLGIRCAESLTRRRAVTCKSGFKAFISSTPFKHIRKAYPVYDWSNEDVWRVPQQKGWDYNHAYDVMQRRGIPVHSARCSPPFGDQPVKGLFKFNQCWPELWAKMTERVHGAATAGKYAHTMLYRRNIVEKPEGLTYKQWTLQMIDKLEGKAKIECQNGLKRMIKMHRKKSGDGSVLPDEEPNRKSGLSWKLLTLYGVVGSDKLNRTTQRIGSQSISFREGNYLEKRKQAEEAAD